MQSVLALHTDRHTALGASFKHQTRRLEIVSLQAYLVLCADRSAERRNGSDEGQFTHIDPVDEILPSAVERIVDLDFVIARGRHLEKQHRIHVPTVVVAESHLGTVRPVKPDYRLEPSRNGIRHIRHEHPSFHLEHQVRPLWCTETETVFVAAQDLAVESNRKAARNCGKFRGSVLEHIRQLANLEIQPVGGTVRHQQPQITKAQLRILAHAEAESYLVRQLQIVLFTDILVLPASFLRLGF